MNVFKITLLLSLMAISPLCLSQTDSIPQKLTAYVADKFAATRVLNVEFKTLAPYKFSSESAAGKLPESKVKNLFMANASVNGNFIVKKNWMLGANMTYRYLSSSIEKTDDVSGAINIEDNDFHYHTTSLNFTYITKLWNKPTFFTATVTVDGSENHFERIKGLATGTVLITANAKTKLGLGLAGIIDPTSQVPVIPIVTYEHKFNNGWTLDFILPKHAYLKRNLLKNGRISIGSEFESTNFYMYDFDEKNGTYEFRQIEVNSGFMYEQHLGGSFIATLKSGMKIIPNGRVFEKNESFDSYLFQAKPKPSFYLNLGISFNPFGKLFK